MVVDNLVSIILISGMLGILTYMVTPTVARQLKRMKIVGIDVHKARRPRIPEMGGVVIILPLIVILGFAYFLTGSELVLFVLASTAFFGAYGLLDDMVQLGKYEKLGLSAAIGFLLLVPMNVNFLFLPVLLVLVIGMGNIFNIFAGFNGLEIGTSSFVALFFSLLCLITGNIVPFYLSLGFFVILFAFLQYNKYPARIFPGNIGTFTVGGFFAGICLYYNLYYLIIPLLTLHLGDIALKGISAGYFSSSEMKRTRINEDEILVPRNDYLSLSRLVLKLKPMSEKQLVNFFWEIMLVIGTSTVLVTGVLL